MFTLAVIMFYIGIAAVILAWANMIRNLIRYEEYTMALFIFAVGMIIGAAIIYWYTFISLGR